MAAYIDQAYYDDVYKGRPVSAADFPRLALRASERVDSMTFCRVSSARLDSFDAKTQAAIKNATCAIVEGLSTFEAHTDGGVITTSESATGAYSYTVDAGSIKAAMDAATASARAYLVCAGLLYAGVGC